MNRIDRKIGLITDLGGPLIDLGISIYRAIKLADELNELEQKINEKQMKRHKKGKTRSNRK